MANKELMTTQVAIMLEMQDAMNTKVADNWFAQGFEWYRAIWIECGEMLEHYGWKWWKHQKPDAEQVKMELVDIFHFGLSSRIDGETSYQVIAENLVDEITQPLTKDDFKKIMNAKKFEDLEEREQALIGRALKRWERESGKNMNVADYFKAVRNDLTTLSKNL